MNAHAGRASPPVERARQALAASGVCPLSTAEVTAYTGTDATGWARFARHWEELAPTANR
ncbi:hypothetical protein [Streptomyces sp. NPDC057877]|uniref:hypothetical protein n=1 Tax=Streptomyces sp. NPDC057877 TaxID=3346269 RepID=UPI00368E465F